MKNLIAANWKMNPVSQKEAEDIFSGIKKGINGAKSEIIICPPFVYIPILNPIPYTLNPKIAFGAQDVFFEDNGAFTGEISPAMLRDLEVEYAIIGHSERRKYFGETDEIINKKIKKALEFGLKVIFCIGETQEQRDSGEKFKVLENQIKKGLDGISNEPYGEQATKFQISNLSVAYEPVWAIGTGNNCSIEETKKSIDFIRKLAPENIRILYGGSVRSENSGAYVKDAGANGLLVGGASLNAEEFIKIVKSVE